tara:strand:- start:177 stop:356 length:180 start_codon:yes stop_codon:yes gene_type:complete
MAEAKAKEEITKVKFEKKAKVSKVIPKKEVAMTKDYNKYGLYLGIGLVALVILSSILGS